MAFLRVTLEHMPGGMQGPVISSHLEVEGDIGVPMQAVPADDVRARVMVVQCEALFPPLMNADVAIHAPDPRLYVNEGQLQESGSTGHQLVDLIRDLFCLPEEICSRCHCVSIL
jgi:hypothetical protein